VGLFVLVGVIGALAGGSSSGARRAIDMKREANSTSLDVPATTAAAQD